LKVTIITAVLNGERVIADTLASVAAQRYGDIEHIVVDGASRDGTLEKIREHGEHVAKVICERDSGVYEAFNKGLRAASGEVVGFLNAGDVFVDTDVIGKIVAAFDAPSIGAVFGDLVITHPDDPGFVLRHYSGSGFSPGSLALGFAPPHPTLYVRREIYAACGGYDPSYRIAGDFDICLKLFLGRSTLYNYIPEVLVRMPSGGLSNSGLASIIRNTRENLVACRKNGVPTSFVRMVGRLPVKWFEGRKRA
jgi:glycosyltransferase involved in cell wall biosynthesis